MSLLHLADHLLQIFLHLLLQAFYQAQQSGSMSTTKLGSSIWNPTPYRPHVPAWKYPSATKTHQDNQEYEFPNFQHPNLSSPGRRPPVSDMNIGNHRDLSPMVMSPDRSVKIVEKPKPVCSPIVIPDSPSPSVITISSCSDRSNSLDITGQSSPTFSNEGIADDVFVKPRNNFILNSSERNLRAQAVDSISCTGYCSRQSDDCRGLTNHDTERDIHRPWRTLAEHASGHKLSCTRDIWISPKTSSATKQVENVDYFNIDDTDDEFSAIRCTSPEIPFVKGERIFDGSSGRSVDFEKACKVRRTGKNHLSCDFETHSRHRDQEVQNHHPLRDQETQTLHETASAFMNPTDSSRARDFIEMSRQNHSPGVKLQAGNSFQLLPTFIPVPSDPSGACFVSPTLGYAGGASAHAPFPQMPSTAHMFHPSNGSGQEHFVYLPSQMYSHVPHSVSTVYTSHVPNVTTVGSHSGVPVILAPGRVAYNGPHASVPNFTIPGPSFVSCSSPSASMRHGHAPGNVNTYRQYLMRPGAGCIKK